jgi:predicted RNA-binding Zn-ribbon protein involved in translation (DUF1610 family)
MLWEERTRKPIPMKVKRQVYKRAKGRCEKCGIKLKMSEGDFHHIRDPTVTPRPSSVRFLCPLCHRKYGHKIIVRRVDADTFWETKKVRIVPKDVVKVKKKKSKVRRKAIRDFWGNIIGYRTVKPRKRKATRKRRSKTK